MMSFLRSVMTTNSSSMIITPLLMESRMLSSHRIDSSGDSRTSLRVSMSLWAFPFGATAGAPPWIGMGHDAAVAHPGRSFNARLSARRPA